MYFLSREKVPKSARGGKKDATPDPLAPLWLYERLFCLAALVRVLLSRVFFMLHHERVHENTTINHVRLCTLSVALFQTDTGEE